MTGGARRSWRAVARQKRALWPEREQMRQRGGSRHSPMWWSDVKQLKHLFPAFALSSESQRAAPKGGARGREATWPLLKGSDGCDTIVSVTDRILSSDKYMSGRGAEYHVAVLSGKCEVKLSYDLV